VKFLVENNVVSSSNVKQNGTHSLLCADIDEVLQLVTETRADGFGLLLDTAHLKVSAYTLGFDAEKFVSRARNFIVALHHSDNNGKADTNHPLTNDYWFAKFMPWFKDQYHILEVHDQSVEEVKTQRALLEKWASL
jgi:uncharacterized protein (UPF0276 family)